MMQENIEKMGAMVKSFAKFMGIALLRLSELLLGAVGVWFVWNFVVVSAFQAPLFRAPPATYVQVLSVWLLVYMVKGAGSIRLTDKKDE